MNKILGTTLTVIAVLALAGVIFFAGSMYARTNTYGFSMMSGWNNNNVYGPGGMMGSGRGPSMMRGYGNNNTNGHGLGGMMNGYDYNNANLPPLTVDQAKAAAEKYLANF